MFVILLKFADKSKAKDQLQGHNAWIEQNIKDGKFLVVGSLEPARGGAIIAHGEDLQAVQDRINQDPFVQHNVVDVEIIQISPNKTSAALQFLLDAAC